MSKKICFIGHRKIFNNNISQKLKSVIETEIKNGCLFFTMGTHGEFDRLALGVCRNLRNAYKNIKIEVVLTNAKSFKKQIAFDDEFGKTYYEPFGDVSTIVYPFEEEYFKRQIVVSNRCMIDTCDTLICYVNDRYSPSGAKQAMNYAKRKGLKIINLFSE